MNNIISIYDKPIIILSLPHLLIYCSAVAVVDIETSFSAELNNQIIIKLDRDPIVASSEIIKYYKSHSVPDEKIINNWIDNHYKNNRNPLEKYLA